MSEEGTYSARRDGPHVIRMRIDGRVTASMIKAWSVDWHRLHDENPDLGRARFWFFDAVRIVSYSADAVPEATRMMMRLKGLEAIIVASKSTLVKLGATMVQKALKATTGVEVHVLESLDDAEKILAKKLAGLAAAS